MSLPSLSVHQGVITVTMTIPIINHSSPSSLFPHFIASLSIL